MKYCVSITISDDEVGFTDPYAERRLQLFRRLNESLRGLAARLAETGPVPTDETVFLIANVACDADRDSGFYPSLVTARAAAGKHWTTLEVSVEL